MRSSHRPAHDRDEQSEPSGQPEPANRAERRARGRRSAQPPTPAKVQPTHLRDAGQARQWANRRTG